MAASCGNDAAVWEKRLRHSLIQFLLLDLNCEDEGKLFKGVVRNDDLLGFVKSDIARHIASTM